VCDRDSEESSVKTGGDIWPSQVLFQRPACGHGLMPVIEMSRALCFHPPALSYMQV
jgi:hypothetical protein